jgi:hypothetical protein
MAIESVADGPACPSNITAETLDSLAAGNYEKGYK